MKNGLSDVSLIYVSDAPAYGGAERYQTMVIRESCARGLSVWAVIYEEMGTWGKELEDVGARVRHWRGILGWLGVLREAARQRTTIIHINASWRGNLLPHICLANAIGRKVILTEHTVPPVQPTSRRFGALAPWRIRLRLRTLRRRVEWALADRVIVVGNIVKDRLIRERGLSERRCVVIPNGVDATRFSPTKGLGNSTRERLGIRTEFVVGSVGRLAGEKAYDRLIRAVARLKQEDVCLLLVGDGPVRSALEAEASRLGITDRVRFVGWQEDVNAFLNAMDVFALSSDFEALPFSALEAMAAGLPVVATDVGGVREAVLDGETGYIVPQGDEDALADRIDCLLADSTLRKQMGRAGRDRVGHHFSFDRMIRKTFDVYNQVAGN